MTELAAPAVAHPPSDEHFRTVALRAHDLIVFLGADANTDEADGPWQRGSGRLPNDRELARHLASRAGLKDAPLELAEVAQRARAGHGETAVFDWLAEALVLEDGTGPSPVHQLLAGLPGHFQRVGLEPRYQMIVTTNYDGTLERAFRDANEAYDVAVYATSRQGRPGIFVHAPWSGRPRAVELPNEYPPTSNPELGFPVVAPYRRLMRTVIVRLSRAIDDDVLGSEWDNNCIITEDDYIDYMSGRPVEAIVPKQILLKLKKANYLFLGYTFIPWRLRVFMHRVWGGPNLGGGKHWAVQAKPDQLEKDLWDEAGVTLYQQGARSYLESLYSFVESHVDELRP